MSGKVSRQKRSTSGRPTIIQVFPSPGDATNSRCTACGAQVRWARTKANKPMILDAKPNTTGNCELAGILYMPHWATCPQAATFRKGLRQRKP